MTALAPLLIASRNPEDVLREADDRAGEARWEQRIADENRKKGKVKEAERSEQRVARLNQESRRLTKMAARLFEGEREAAE